jgi:hypothetical protein
MNCFDVTLNALQCVTGANVVSTLPNMELKQFTCNHMGWNHVVMLEHNGLSSPCDVAAK